ncbi:MAG TPA: hypothetical protein VGB08_09290 [Allosphingosinicella sp.]|jgi:hypothetical protein
MTRRPPKPLRFVGLVVGLWICARTAVLAPEWWVERGIAAPVPEGAETRVMATAPEPSSIARVAAFRGRPERRIYHPGLRPLAPRTPGLATRSEPRVQLASLVPQQPPPAAPTALLPSPAPGERPLSRAPRPGRWSGSAWLLLRNERERALAPGGTLGGSQSGVRLVFRLNRDAARPLALSARLYAPLRGREGAEAAAGLDWRPLAGVPVHILAERRQALGRDGRSAFALALHGGVSERRLPGGARLDAYGQAGIVGARSRDLFADGGARISVPAGRVSLGGGLWGGTQPGATRLDAGPHASIRLPLAGEALRLSAEWRFRLAGDARPGSGPVLSLASDF